MNETYYIPTNFTDAGRVMGLFEIRNMIEAILLTLPILYLCIVLLPLALTPKIMVTMTVIVPVGGFGLIGISDAIRHRFFLIFQYEANMKSKGHSVSAIIQRLNEEADTARRCLDLCELEVLEPRFSDDFILKLLYEIINKRTSQRVKLPEGVFDMTTAIHGIYE